MEIILIAIAQAITEMLPVSSNEHLLILGNFLDIQDEVIKALAVFLHLGSACGLCIYFKKDIFPLRIILLVKMSLIILPSVLLMLTVSFFDINIAIITKFTSINMIIGAIILILVYNLNIKSVKHSIKQINLVDSLIIGLFQLFSIFTGFSRLGSNLIACKILKINDKTAIKFSLISAIPTMISAFMYKSITTNNPEVFTDLLNFQTLLAILIVVLITVSLAKTLMEFLYNHIIGISVYKVTLAILILLVL
ncbi:hypothetical protein GUI12_03525 [Anaplasmataceae bacterium AB001_6]|nr:hypothetical protein GUI12_03525 [Anaplasmataceae bacterium AB001_6]